MSFSIVKVQDRPISTQYTEIIMDSSSDASSLPANVADGSIAYTSDLSSIYLFKGGSWVATA